MFPGERVVGDASFLDAIVYTDSKASPDERLKKVERLLSVSIERKSRVVTLTRTQEGRTKHKTASDANNRLVAARLAELANAASNRARSADQRVEEILEKFRAAARSAERDEWETDPNATSIFGDVWFPIHQFARDFFIKYAEGRILSAQPLTTVVYCNAPTSFQQPMGETSKGDLELLIQTEARLSALWPEMKTKDPFLAQVVADKGSRFDSVTPTSVVSVHVTRFSPRYYYLNTACYSSDGALLDNQSMVFDGRNIVLPQWVSAWSPDFPESLSVAITPEMQAWMNVLRADPARGDFSTGIKVPETEPLDVVFREGLDRLGAAMNVKVWAWLPDTALDGLAQKTSAEEFDFAGHLRWLVATGRITMERDGDDLFIRPGDPVDALDSQVPRGVIKDLLRQLASQGQYEFSTWLQLTSRSNWSSSDLRRQIAKALIAMDDGLTVAGYSMPAFVSRVLLRDGLYDRVAKYGRVETSMANLSPEMRKDVHNWLSNMPKPNGAQAIADVPDIQLNATFSRALYSSAEQRLSGEIVFEDRYTALPWRAGLSAWSPMTAQQIGGALGNLLYTKEVTREEIDRLEVRVVKRPTILLRYTIADKIVFEEKILGRIPDEQSEPIKFTSLPPAALAEFNRALAEWEELIKKRDGGG